MGSKKIGARVELVSREPEVYRIKIPFANLGLDDTNCYVVKSGDDALIIDPGTRTVVSRGILAQSCAQIGVDLRKARYLLTHLHFDHAGIIPVITEPGTEILMGATAFSMNAYRDRERRTKLVQRRLRDEGAKYTATRGLVAITSEARVCDLPGREYTLLYDGEEVVVGDTRLRVIETPGHTYGDICLLFPETGLLITGDTVLDIMVPGLSLPMEGVDVMAVYLESLRDLRAAGCKLALPGHGEPFENLDAALDRIVAKHTRRLQEVYEIAAKHPDLLGTGIISKMKWSAARNGWEKVSGFTRIAVSSSGLSYLDYLKNLGELVCEHREDGNHYRVS